MRYPLILLLILCSQRVLGASQVRFVGAGLSDAREIDSKHSYKQVGGLHLRASEWIDVQAAVTKINESELGYAQILIDGLSLKLEKVSFGAILGFRSGIGTKEVDAVEVMTKHSILGGFVGTGESQEVGVRISYESLNPYTRSRKQIDSFNIHYNRESIKRFALRVEGPFQPISFGGAAVLLTSLKGRYDFVGFSSEESHPDLFYWFGYLEYFFNERASIRFSYHQISTSLKEGIFNKIYGSLADLEAFSGGSLGISLHF